MKKVLLVTFSDNADHQDTAFGLYEQLSGKLDVYLMAIQEPKVPLKKDDHIWLVDCPERPGICRKTFHLALLLRLIRRIRKERFDAVYFESLHVWNLPVMLFGRRTTRKYHVIHEVIPHEGDKQEKLVHLMNRAVCLLADTIVLHNQTYIDHLAERYGVARERICFLELWRRYPAFNPPVHSGRALFFGRINPYKGADNLLQIAKLCPEITFDVTGRVDPQMETVAAELTKLPNIHMNRGYVSDEQMRQAFVRADWIVLPYNSASQSGVIIDAYKYSRPVIAYDVGAIAEQVSEGESGHLVPPGDNMCFAQKLRAAMAMPRQAYDSLCESAYRYGYKKYAAAGAAARFMEILK